MATLTGKEIGKYRIGERIGRGGMADVYIGVHTHLDRQVAIKVLHGYLLEGGDFIKRFKREAKAVAALRHPNIVQVYDFDVQDELIFMVMEYIEGTNLQKRMSDLDRKGERLPITTIGSIINDIASALDYAHSKEMLHRDVKPSNILLDKNDKAYLTDFGIARLLSDQRFTATGTLVGTPAYMSPEQGMGEELTRESDIYSLGVVAFELITGQVPYDAKTPIAIVQKQISEPIPALKNFVDDVPDSAQEVIDTALAKSPSERYSSAEELVLAIRNALQALEIREPTAKLAAQEVFEVQSEELFSPTVEMQEVVPAEEFDKATVVMEAEKVADEFDEPATPPVKESPAAAESSLIGGKKGRDQAAVGARVPFFGSSRNRILSVVVGIAVIIGAIFGIQALGKEQPAVAPTPAQVGQASPVSEMNGEEFFNQGTEFIGQAKWGEAIEAFNMAVGAGFDTAELHHLMAVAFISIGSPDEAIAAWTRAIELDEGNFEYWRERGLARSGLGDLNGALADLTHALELNPDDVMAYLGIARIQKNTGDYSAALGMLDRALEHDPQNPGVHVLRGEIFWEMNRDQAGAEEEFDLAIQYARSDDPEPYRSRAQFFVWTERCNLAVIDYTSYIDRVQDDPRVYQERGDCYHQLGKNSLAMEDFQTFLNLTEGNPEFEEMRQTVVMSLNTLPMEVVEIVFAPDFEPAGLFLVSGRDVDTELITTGADNLFARRTGNGEALPSEDGNGDPDFFMGFDVANDFMYQGSPASWVQFEIEYLDDGLDLFSVQYDSIEGEFSADARFKEAQVVQKTGSGEFKTLVVTVDDAYFGDRSNGYDFRISDGADGPEIIGRVSVTLLPAKEE